MNLRIEYKDLREVDRALGLRVVPNHHIGRHDIVVDITQNWLYVHPGEEHMVWASLGFIDEAFYKLNRSVESQIARHARHAEEKLRVKTVGEIRNEVADRVALVESLLANW